MTANIFEALNESVVLISWRECCCLKIWTWKKLPWSSATTQAATNKCDAARALCSSTVTLPRHLFPLVPFLFGASSSRCTSSCCYVHSRVPPTLIPITCDSRVSLKLGYLVVARGHTLHLASGLNLTGECVSSSPTTHIWPGFNIQLCCFPVNVLHHTVTACGESLVWFLVITDPYMLLFCRSASPANHTIFFGEQPFFFHVSFSLTSIL